MLTRLELIYFILYQLLSESNIWVVAASNILLENGMDDDHDCKSRAQLGILLVKISQGYL